ncbi:hypothetical protein TSTA_014140 [Talaromyces stipitatus ATCC 10500]|uniref:Uncharacterized protein n=1 Tax=Talaromyces stipitatus (strain ATCC 10500 / CBS 375.48 / QM 6759 / NRRL 1006) TaxID=441959 RepID=B8MGT7_TALSN|nr:uncharacterized protein TSTA_014140 [Talaromyces stipitatus ATCC 10500]EED16318.1 hypothetical protein TSTA_014140 [Talaromyces stipitatus ATCC 10500]
MRLRRLDGKAADLLCWLSLICTGNYRKPYPSSRRRRLRYRGDDPRKLFTTTVAPVTDYTSEIGGIAATGAFRTVATAVVEAEANICSFGERHIEKSTKLWADIRALPRTNPLNEAESHINSKAFLSTTYTDTRKRALPVKHTHDLYDRLKRKEAMALAQLRMGMTRLNSYPNKTGAAESDLCACKQCIEMRRGSLSFYLGGKARSDPEQWRPDIKAPLSWSINLNSLGVKNPSSMKS